MIYPWHQPIWRSLQSLLKKQQLADNYLFHAHKAQGLPEFATALSNAIFCQSFEHCQQCKGCHNMADRLLISPDEGNHHVQGIRDMSQWLQTTPTQGTTKLVLIMDLEQLNHHAMNALLKTLEEPPTYACFILSCHQLDKVLPTVRSRCQVIALPSPSQADLADDVKTYHLPQHAVQQLFQFKPLDIGHWAEKQHDVAYQQIIEALLQRQLEGIEMLQKILDEMPEWTFDFMLHLHKDIILNIIGQKEYKIFKNITFSKQKRHQEALNGLFLLYEQLLAYKDAMVGQHVGFHKPLLVEHIWNQWSGCIHGTRVSTSI